MSETNPEVYDTFKITYQSCLDHIVDLISLDEAVSLPFEQYQPVRRPRAYHGQRHLPGWYWFSKTGRLVYHESHLEKGQLMLLDFDPKVVAVATQPFALHYTLSGNTHVHYPDIFCRFADGHSLVVDVKPTRNLDMPKNRRAFEATRAACEQIGWAYQVCSEPHPTLLANTTWLAGYRRTPTDAVTFSEPLLQACSESAQPIGQLVAQVGPSYLVRPVLFWLLWQHLLHIDLYKPMTNHTLVSLSEVSL